MTIMAKKKKKKGRPSLLDLEKRSLKQQLLLQRQNPNDSTEVVAGDEEDERKEKKHKFVLGFTGPTLLFNDDHDLFPNTFTSEKALKATDRSSVVGVGVVDGFQIESGPTTPLPDKKLLLFILDRLQKKDTYGVFSDPVDPDQIPDYHEIIANPMDFGTVRTKLDSGAYTYLEQFENDILLICSNAMEYNSEDTIYYRQARSILELAKKDFENLREESDDGEPPPPPKIVKRGRPPGKKVKNTSETSLFECVAPETFSNSNPLMAGENSNGSSGYNLRKGPIPNKFRLSDTINGISLGNDNCPSWVSEWENEFPSSVLKNVLKYGSKRFSIDENKRDTYMNSLTSKDEPSTFTLLDGEPNHLVEVGDPYLEHSYARSLSQFSVGLGPVARKFASMKLERIYHAEQKFAPQSNFIDREDIHNPADDEFKKMLLPETSSGYNSIRGLRNQSDGNACFQIYPNSVLQPCTNVFIGRHGSIGEASQIVSEQTNSSDYGDLFMPQGSAGLGFVGEASMQTYYSVDPNVGVQVPMSSQMQPDLALQLRMGW